MNRALRSFRISDESMLDFARGLWPDQIPGDSVIIGTAYDIPSGTTQVVFTSKDFHHRPPKEGE